MMAYVVCTGGGRGAMPIGTAGNEGEVADLIRDHGEEYGPVHLDWVAVVIIDGPGSLCRTLSDAQMTDLRFWATFRLSEVVGRYAMAVAIASQMLHEDGGEGGAA